MKLSQLCYVLTVFFFVTSVKAEIIINGKPMKPDIVVKGNEVLNIVNGVPQLSNPKKCRDVTGKKFISETELAVLARSAKVNSIGANDAEQLVHFCNANPDMELTTAYCRMTTAFLPWLFCR